MCSKWFLLYIFILFKISEVAPANILSVVLTPTKSHHIWFSALSISLAKRGHQVTYVSPHNIEEQVANLNVSILEPYPPETNKLGAELIQALRDKKSSVRQLNYYYWHNLAKCETVFMRAPFKEMIRSNSSASFDLILFNYGMEDCIFGLIHHLNYPPTILVSPLTYNAHWTLRHFGTPLFTAFPHWMNLYPMPLNLWQRVNSLAITLYDDFVYHALFAPANDRIVRRHFGENIPSIKSLVSSHVSLALINQQTTEYRAPIGVNVVPVGGLHLKPASNLSKDFEDFLNGAEHGAILFSFGGRERTDKIGGMTAEDMMAVFSRLPQRVVWKWTSVFSANFSYVPSNVMLRRWIPQNDILGHPKLRLFISHCGGLSSQEATYHGVPVLAIPFLADQLTNAASVVAKGSGRIIEPDKINPLLFYDNAVEIINKPQYSEAARLSKTIMRSELDSASPLDRAIFWIELVARHRGAPYMRSPLQDIPWPLNSILPEVVIATVGVLTLTGGFFGILVCLMKTLIRRQSTLENGFQLVKKND